MRLVRTAVAVCAALVAATAALAQSGGIEVRVTDPEGLPLPGATVTISHATGYIKTTTEMSDKQGIVAFPVLRPGDGYSILVDFPGFTPTRIDSLHVNLGQTLPIPVQMAEAIEERVNVIAKVPTIDLDQSESSTRFSDDFISDLPVPGRFYQNVLTLAPGVQDANGDGNPNVHGSRARDFQMTVGGVSNVDPLNGTFLSRINTNSIEEMEVITSGAGVEFGRAQGGFGQIIQKQGNNSHEGIVEFYWRTSKLDGDGAADNSDLPPAQFDSYQPGFQFSGPLIKDQLWYRVSYDRIDDEVPVNVVSGVEVFRLERETQDVQVTWQVSPRNKLALQFRGDPAKAVNFGISSTVEPESSRSIERDVSTWTAKWTAPYSPKILADTTVAWQDIGTLDAPTAAGVRNDCVPNADEDFLNEAYCIDNTRGLVSGSYFRTTDDRRQVLSVDGQATVYGGRFWGMTHEFRMGLNITNQRYFRNQTSTPVVNYQEVTFGGNDDGSTPSEDDDEPDLQSFGLVLARFAVPERDEVRATGTAWDVYARDQFKPAQNLTITFGVRVGREEINSEGRAPFDPAAELAAYSDFVNGGGNPQKWPDYFTGYENLAAFTGQLQDIVCAGKTGSDLGNCETQVASSVLGQETESLVIKRKAGNINLGNTNFSPSLSLAWAPWASGKTQFKAAAGRHYNNIPLVVPLQEIEPVVTFVEYRASLTDPESCPPPDPNAPNPPAVACGKTQIVGGIDPLLNVLTVDRNLKTPYQDELSLKVEQELWAETSISLEYVNRRYRDQIQDFNLNLATGDLGRCQRQSLPSLRPIVAEPGASTMSCSATQIACTSAADCPGGESCGYFFNVAGDWLTDEFSGAVYPDTNPGDGDGFLDPMTGSTQDNCVGDTVVNSTEGDEQCTDLFCSNAVILDRPDESIDLYLQSPFWGDIFLIGNFNSIDYEAYVVELERRLYRSWEMKASYTWSEAKGDGEDFFQELGDDPSLRDALFGFQSYDQTHVVKLSATSVTPWGIRLGSSVTWQSGLPYSIVVRQFSADTQAPITEAFGGEGQRPRETYPTGVRNDQRNDSYWNVDLKATKELRLSKGLNLQVSAEVFNVLNDGTYQIYNGFLERGQQLNGTNEATPRFGRQWQMGMKLSF